MAGLVRPLARRKIIDHILPRWFDATHAQLTLDTTEKYDRV